MKLRTIRIFCNNLQDTKEAGLLKNLTVLYVSDDFWIGARGYKLYKYDTKKFIWHRFSKVIDFKYSLLSKLFLTKRLFRAEITQFYRFQENTLICIAKKGIFKYDDKSKNFIKRFSVERGSRPMALCQDGKGVIYFGEYFHNFEKNPIHVYKSDDKGENWQIAFTFPKGSINHIHGTFHDLYSDKIWIMTGDLDDETMLGYTDDGFKSIVPLYKGSQRYRACVPLFYKDKILFATDSQYEQNVIREIDRKTGEVRDLCEIQGSGIYGGQMGTVAFVSTTVEPSNVNKDRNSYLWVSTDGVSWNEILHFEKDCLGKKYFQFGSLRFPHYEKLTNITSLIVTGRALKRLDNNSLILPVSIFK